jgi:hypothetical protein
MIQQLIYWEWHDNSLEERDNLHFAWPKILKYLGYVELLLRTSELSKIRI